jgi:hypothetical protein
MAVGIAGRDHQHRGCGPFYDYPQLVFAISHVDRKHYSPNRGDGDMHGQIFPGVGQVDGYHIAFGDAQILQSAPQGRRIVVPFAPATKAFTIKNGRVVSSGLNGRFESRRKGMAARPGRLNLRVDKIVLNSDHSK